jgi:hypothetical protein
MNSFELQALFDRFKEVDSVARLVDVFAELPPVTNAVEIEMRIFVFRKVKERLFDCDRQGVEALKLEIEEMKKVLDSSED